MCDRPAQRTNSSFQKEHLFAFVPPPVCLFSSVGAGPCLARTVCTTSAGGGEGSPPPAPSVGPSAVTWPPRMILFTPKI